MASNPASASDLIARSLRTLSSQELSVGAVLLDSAWAVIASTVPSVATRLDAVPLDALFQSLVVQVECAMVLRVLNNPDGKLEESGDDYSYRLDQAVSTGSLYLSDAEAGLLALGGEASNTAFTIRPAGRTPDAVYLPSQWDPFL